MKERFSTTDKWVFCSFIIFLLLSLLFGFLGVSDCFMNRYLLVFAAITPPVLLYFSRTPPEQLAELHIARLGRLYKEPLKKSEQDGIRFDTKVKVYLERFIGVTLLIVFWGYIIYLFIHEGFQFLSC